MYMNENMLVRWQCNETTGEQADMLIELMIMLITVNNDDGNSSDHNVIMRYGNKYSYLSQTSNENHYES